VGGMGGAVSFGNQQIDIQAHQLFAGVAEHFLGGMVGDDDGAGLVDLEDGVGSVLDEGAKAAFGEHFGAGVGFLLDKARTAFFEGLCGFGPLGNIAGDLGDADGCAG